MMAVDINQLLHRAEQSFLSGRLDAARADLAKARQAAGDHPAVLHLTALVARNSGDAPAAEEAFLAALRLAPDDARINSNYANLLGQMGQADAALDHYGRAIAADPNLLDARFNRAMLLQKLGRSEEALAEIDSLLAVRSEARFHSARGSLLRALGRLGEASDAFDRALELDPKRLVALHGRARIAIERGEDQAAELYRTAIAAHPGNRQLLLGYAEALEAEGRAGDALVLLDQVLAETPLWIEAQILLARMRWEAGEGRAFTRNLEAIAETQHDNPILWSVLATTLAGADFATEAAEAAATGARATGEPRLRLLEAFLTSEAGQIDDADRLFAALPDGIPDRQFSEARHALRARRFDQATRLLEGARRETPWDIAVWAMTSLAWRLTGRREAEWLNDQPGFVRTMELALDASEIERIAERLRALHRTQKHPLHQSLRGGTQTRGRLFERSEPEIRLLAERIGEAVDHYWDELPPFDAAHPLLRHRRGRPLIEGSWSVRLVGGGFHVAHFHPLGTLSSAAYLVVPEAQAPMEGWLEIGGPPAELDLPLEPLTRIEPQPARLALFPSYMFHGTRPFSEGERLTTAFDVVPG